MYYTDDALLPENHEQLMIRAALWRPQRLPGDFPEDIAVSWDAQVEKTVDCYNAQGVCAHSLGA